MFITAKQIEDWENELAKVSPSLNNLIKVTNHELKDFNLKESYAIEVIVREEKRFFWAKQMKYDFNLMRLTDLDDGTYHAIIIINSTMEDVAMFISGMHSGLRHLEQFYQDQPKPIDLWNKFIQHLKIVEADEVTNFLGSIARYAKIFKDATRK